MVRNDSGCRIELQSNGDDGNVKFPFIKSVIIPLNSVPQARVYPLPVTTTYQNQNKISI